MPTASDKSLPEKGAGALLAVEGLSVEFRTPAGIVRAVDEVSFEVARGETLAIVGESGCGKSVTSLALLGLLDSRASRIAGGRALFDGADLFSMAPKARRKLRGDQIAMIFQEPMTSLNPIMTNGAQVAEALRMHRDLGRGEARDAAIELLRRVRIPDAEQRARQYPHQISGGMRQRVMIAMAIACRPRLLVVDEATTALDVTVQAQIIALLMSLQREFGTAMILITHDLGVVAQMADRVAVFYAGRKVEEATAPTLFAAPSHPYTIGLIGAVPRLSSAADPDAATERLTEIPGVVPSLRALPPGCRFAPRCVRAADICRRESPPVRRIGDGHAAACFFADEAMPGALS